MNIPESGNSLPDILDETRWHMEVMLKMQVPDGRGRAGMAFHKGHDESWTGLGVEPADDTKTRILKPPTTAATLNLAATGAQSYRLWKQYDATFANKCLAAAEKAWLAAVANPAIFAPFDDSIGGGPYGDDYVGDDFYWAASELYAATGSATYLNYIKASTHYLKVPNYLEAGEENKTYGQFNWGNTAALGTLTLALVPSGLSATDVQTAKDNIAAAADFSISVQDKQGYGITIAPSEILDTGIVGYPWGSNSFVTNSCIVLAYAYDYTSNVKYLNGVTEAMDYIMGRNPNERSYITGYGDYAVKYPHHRFFANQIDSSFPLAPAGIAVGGPNSGLQDPWVKGSGWLPGEMAPQKCYMDHIESWSTNECTINWNAPVAWVAAFLSNNGNDGSGTTTTTPSSTTVVTSTATATVKPTSTATATATVKPTSTATPTATVNTATPTTTVNTSTPTPTATATIKPTSTATATATTTVATATVKPTSTATSTSSTGSYTVDYSMNDWGSGATVNVTIVNTGSTVINNWTLKFTFPGNQQISNLWCGKYTQTGTAVAITGETWNASIPVGGSASVGFNITYSSTNEKPTSFTLVY
jgi:hypothetical protein